MRLTNTLILILACHFSFGQTWVDTTFNILTELDIPYGVATNFAGAEDSLKLDISYPENDLQPICGRPLMVIVHGGAWFAGDKNGGYPRLLRQDFAKRGYVTASVNYRLGQFHTNQYINCNIPEWNCFNMTDSSEFYRANYRAIQDVNGAIRFLINHKDEYQIDPNNIFVVGESAGGFVAMGVGFMDDESEVLENLVSAYPDAPPPNQLYENPCIQNYGLANDISSMDLSRPDLGSYEGDLNFPLSSNYTIQAVGNIYGGAFNNIYQSFTDDSPDLYLYHQPCDLIVPFVYNKVLNGYNYCLSQFPTFCGNIVNRPFVYGSKGIKDLIDTMVMNSIPTSDYYFDNSGNNYSCLQQIDPNFGCHSIDAYWLRTTNMASYFANSIEACIVDNTSAPSDDHESIIQTLYPNPTEDFIHIKFNKHVNHVSIQILDLFGSVKENYSFNQLTETKISMNHLAKGVYTVILFHDGKIENRLFMKI